MTPWTHSKPPNQSHIVFPPSDPSPQVSKQGERVLHLTTLCAPASGALSTRPLPEAGPNTLGAAAAPAEAEAEAPSSAAPVLESVSYLFKCRQLSEIDALYGALCRAIGQTP